ncbi:DNA modification methylase [Bacillus infantis]|uniref:Methyltransferase n=1 Tax=Bacillus infantis TaxID=324767 RepID=A0A5D4S150_9BACI|nr:site-specific DNA-methyltransferase [Bacillus infantis]TYS55764.1 DNA modification methylase [Bacillus infantis]
MEIKKIHMNQINPAPYNPRKDLKPGDEEYEKLKRSIQEFGYVEPMVWNTRTGNLVGGHQRYKILKENPLIQMVDVSVVDLDDTKEKALNIALNKISGDWDEEKLVELLQELKEEDLDLALTGYDLEEAEQLISEFNLGAALDDLDAVEEDEFNPDEAYEEAKRNPKAKPGDVWQLGRHRLMCGDSTSSDDVAKLMNGQRAEMIFTDPPYNVNYQGGAGGNREGIKNDHMDSESFLEFLRAVYKNMAAHTAEGGAIYVCHADTEGESFRKGLREAGFLLKQCLIWVKNTFVLSRQDYHWQHEPILYGWKEGAAHRWNGDRLQSTTFDEVPDISIVREGEHHILTFNNEERSIVIRAKDIEIMNIVEDDQKSAWRIDKPSRSEEHPTMKPLAVPARGIINSSRPGEIVMDLFGGSGSTLIAAEKTGRICYTMELDPGYADVIIKRYEELTGEPALLIE